MCVYVWKHLSSTLTANLYHTTLLSTTVTSGLIHLISERLYPFASSSLFSPHSSLSQRLFYSLILWVWLFFFKLPHVCGMCVLLCVLVTHLCPNLCYPVDHSPPGSSVHWILQARIPEWVAIMLSKICRTEKDILRGVCDVPCIVCFSAWLIFT